ncbi:MAG: hypothetical protein ACXVRJ_15270 [Gaiellaceae bacterium]
MRKALLLLPVAALLAACGGGQPKPKVYTSPAAPQYVMPKGKHYLGKNSKTIGTIVVTRPSVLHWSTDSVVFQLWDEGQKIRVHTQEHAGTVSLSPGTYPKVSVIALGNWLITISPK